MMANEPHVNDWTGRTKLQTDGFLFDSVYIYIYVITRERNVEYIESIQVRYMKVLRRKREWEREPRTCCLC